MKDIAIYGAGGLGRELACLIDRINSETDQHWNIIGFFDDGKEIGEEISHFGKCLGGIEQLNSYDRPLAVILAFGLPATTEAVHGKIHNPNVYFPNLIDASFIIADPNTFEIGEGNIITRGCAVSTEIHIGNFNLFNADIGMGHDVKVGDYNAFMPGSTISGGVAIGHRNLFGSGCFVKQYLKIGNDVTVSPLSALLTKPKDGKVYIGNPAKLFRY